MKGGNRDRLGHNRYPTDIDGAHVRIWAWLGALLLLPGVGAQISAVTDHSGTLSEAGAEVTWGPFGACGSPRREPTQHLIWGQEGILFDADPGTGACVRMVWPLEVPVGTHRMQVELTGTRVRGEAGSASADAQILGDDGVLASSRLWTGAGPVAATTLETSVTGPRDLQMVMLLEAVRGPVPLRLSVSTPEVRFIDGPSAQLDGATRMQSWLGAQLIAEERWHVPVAEPAGDLRRQVHLEIPSEYTIQSVRAGGDVIVSEAVVDPATGTTRLTIADPGAASEIVLTTLANRIPGDATTHLSGIFALGLVATLASGATAVLGARRVQRVPGVRRRLLWGLVGSLVIIDVATVLRLADPDLWPLMVSTPLPPAGVLAYAGLFLLTIIGVLTILWAANFAHRHARGQVAAERENAKRLSQVNEHLDLFAAAVAHDLKGPVASSAQATRLVMETDGERLSGRSREALHLVAGSLDRLGRMVQDLLELAEAEGPPEPAQVSLEAVVKDVLETVRPRLAHVGGTIDVGHLGEVHGDRARLVRLVHNLVENGIEYRSDAPPRIHISHIAQPDADILLVEDNGRGIAAEDLARVFEPFCRGSDEGSGRGLGLAIVRRIVQMHGGTISLRSSLGQGTQFQIRLPKHDPAHRHLLPTTTDGPVGVAPGRAAV